MTCTNLPCLTDRVAFPETEPVGRPPFSPTRELRPAPPRTERRQDMTQAPRIIRAEVGC
jgi:hypothetical protein